jgi:hypothetical protein
MKQIIYCVRFEATIYEVLTFGNTKLNDKEQGSLPMSMNDGKTVNMGYFSFDVLNAFQLL